MVAQHFKKNNLIRIGISDKYLGTKEALMFGGIKRLIVGDFRLLVHKW